ncbi:DNA-directed RNA polymerase subunit beta [Acrasis kona]|uniref:DNA-directed RNA polymerase subunit beta n=1 Tax=Acrasis kona TaxID=1008807 RepID=A0AAW2YX76_9EUKA
MFSTPIQLVTKRNLISDFDSAKSNNNSNPFTQQANNMAPPTSTQANKKRNKKKAGDQYMGSFKLNKK